MFLSVENYAEGNLLKAGQTSSIIIVNDDCAAHVSGYGRTVFITGSKAEVVPHKYLGDRVDFIFVLNGKDNKDRLLIVGNKGHTGGGYTGAIAVCDLGKLRDQCKEVGVIAGDVAAINKEDALYRVNLKPIASGPEIYMFEVKIQKEINDKVVRSKKCTLKYQWDGMKLASPPETKRCLKMANDFLPGRGEY